MPTHENLAVAYHQQDTDYYCGAACAQMVLDSLGAGLLDQNVLYDRKESLTSDNLAINRLHCILCVLTGRSDLGVYQRGIP